MKKLTALLLTFVMAFAMTACGGNEKQDAILKYINEDIPYLAEIETRMLESYNGVLGNNYTDDATAYEEITTNTMTIARELNTAATSVESTDPDVIKVNAKYIEFTTKYLNALTLIKTAIETQDATMVVEANNILSEANTLAAEYTRAVYELAEANNIEFEG